MNLSGIIGYPVTPFSQNNKQVDLNKLGSVIDVLLEALNSSNKCSTCCVQGS